MNPDEPNANQVHEPAANPQVPWVGLKEAARLCSVSPGVIRRRKDELQEQGATASEDGWRIPIPALVNTGLLDRVTPANPPQTQDEPAANPHGTPYRTRDESPEQTITLPLSEFQELVSEAARSNERAKLVAQLEGENHRLIRQIEPPSSAMETDQEAHVVDLREADRVARKQRWWRRSR